MASHPRVFSSLFTFLEKYICKTCLCVDVQSTELLPCNVLFQPVVTRFMGKSERGKGKEKRKKKGFVKNGCSSLFLLFSTIFSSFHFIFYTCLNASTSSTRFSTPLLHSLPFPPYLYFASYFGWWNRLFSLYLSFLSQSSSWIFMHYGSKRYCLLRQFRWISSYINVYLYLYHIKTIYPFSFCLY